MNAGENFVASSTETRRPSANIPCHQQHLSLAARLAVQTSVNVQTSMSYLRWFGPKFDQYSTLMRCCFGTVVQLLSPEAWRRAAGG